MKRAFTLIELLIVIAIIAILALIAVPNFLEAQVRAKVSRVYADMRTMGVAIEAYTVDWGVPPLGQVSWGRDPHIVPVPSGEVNNVFRNIHAQARLTTPVSYVSTIFIDPFIDATKDSIGRRQYVYHDYVCSHLADNHRRNFTELGFMWGLQTRGPSRINVGGIQTIIYSTNPKIYDSTNGTLSEGAIIRTNKGVLGRPQRQ